jgi:hypothetical protein
VAPVRGSVEWRFDQPPTRLREASAMGADLTIHKATRTRSRSLPKLAETLHIALSANDHSLLRAISVQACCADCGRDSGDCGKQQYDAHGRREAGGIPHADPIDQAAVVVWR